MASSCSWNGSFFVTLWSKIDHLKLSKPLQIFYNFEGAEIAFTVAVHVFIPLKIEDKSNFTSSHMDSDYLQLETAGGNNFRNHGNQRDIPKKESGYGKKRT